MCKTIFKYSKVKLLFFLPPLKYNSQSEQTETLWDSTFPTQLEENLKSYIVVWILHRRTKWNPNGTAVAQASVRILLCIKSFHLIQNQKYKTLQFLWMRGSWKFTTIRHHHREFAHNSVTVQQSFCNGPSQVFLIYQRRLKLRRIIPVRTFHSLIPICG